MPLYEMTRIEADVAIRWDRDLTYLMSAYYNSIQK
jgi:hypothetical protein